MIATFENAFETLETKASTCAQPGILKILEFLVSTETQQTIFYHCLVDAHLFPSLHGHYQTLIEYRALSDKLRLIQAKSPEVPLDKETCIRIVNAMLRSNELGAVADVMDMVQPLPRPPLPLDSPMSPTFVGATVTDVPEKKKTPMANGKAGKALEDYCIEHGLDTIVSKDNDGVYTFLTKSDGTQASLDRDHWKSCTRFIRAAVYSIRHGNSTGDDRAQYNSIRTQVHGAQHRQQAPVVPPQPSATSPPAPSAFPALPPPAPRAPPAMVPLAPLAVGNNTQAQIDAMHATLQEQSATLRRTQDLQEQQSLANAQIMTSISFLADTFKTRVEIQSDLEEDQEEHNGFEMDRAD